MEVWTIYVSPDDYPGKVVVRRFALVGGQPIPTGLPIVCASVEAARAAIPAGLACIHRSPDDEPCIIETWL